MYLAYSSSVLSFNGLKILKINCSSNIFQPSFSNSNMASYKQSPALPIDLIDQSWADKVCVFPEIHCIGTLMDKWRIDISRDREIISTEYRMMDTFSCKILLTSRVDNASSKNSFYNNAFVYAATDTLRTISFLAPVVCSTGYNGE